MKKTEVCIKCGSNSVLSQILVAPKNYPNAIEIRVPKESTGIFGSAFERADVQAWVCKDCGYLELYAV